MISNEVMMLDKMYKQYMQMAKAMGFSALLDDTCVSPFLGDLVECPTSVLNPTPPQVFFIKFK